MKLTMLQWIEAVNNGPSDSAIVLELDRAKTIRRFANASEKNVGGYKINTYTKAENGNLVKEAIIPKE